MTARTLTAAQERALAWLPSDGGWSEAVPETSRLGRSLWAVWRRHKRALGFQFAPDGGLNYRITPAGIALKAGRGG